MPRFDNTNRSQGLENPSDMADYRSVEGESKQQRALVAPETEGRWTYHITLGRRPTLRQSAERAKDRLRVHEKTVRHVADRHERVCRKFGHLFVAFRETRCLLRGH
jgi:hypothetical protein